MDTPADHTTLIESLRFAVALRMMELGRLDSATRALRQKQWAADAADAIAHGGDTLQYGSKRRGEVARVFNAAARGIAAGAYQPGGITAFGVHWCVKHSRREEAA